MWTYFLALCAKLFGPLIVSVAPSLVPFVGWIKPVLRFLKYAAIIGVVAYVTAWFVRPKEDLHAQCQAAVDRASRVALQLKAQSDIKAQKAAEAARDAMSGDLEAAIERAQALERELAKHADDPIVYPKSLTKELRR